jgi:hypothetical protein
MDFLKAYHPHHYRNRFLLNAGGYRGYSSSSSSSSGGGVSLPVLYNYFLALSGGTMDIGATITFQELDGDENVSGATLAYSDVDWVNHAKDWFYMDENGVVHSRYNFAGDHAVSCYGVGSSSGGGEGGGYIVVDGTPISAMTAGDNIIFSISSSTLTISATGGGGGSATTIEWSAITHNPLSAVTIEQIENWNNAANNAHSHTNKSILDNITQTSIDNWDLAYLEMHVHNNLNVLSGITQTDVGNWDSAYANMHTHANKAILDSITQNAIDRWESGYTYGVSAYTDLNDWFYKDSSGNVHSRYNLIGDYAVSCYGTSTGGGGEYSPLVISGHSISSMTAGNNINFSISDGNVEISATGGGGSASSVEWTAITHNPLSAATTGSVAEWNDAYQQSHSHPNKGVLDNLTQSVIDNSHTHNNKAVLDTITSAKTTNWDNAATNSHTHANKDTLDTITSAKTTHWDEAYDAKHTHANKAVLDGIDQNDIDKWDSGYTYGVSAYTDLNDWFYRDASGFTHSKYGFVGDLSVSAYGTATSEGGGGGAAITADGRTISIITASGGTKLSGTGNTLVISSHTHSNMDALNSISSTNITNWNNSVLSAHTHNNISVLDLITNTKLTNWDNAASNSHTHTNKSVLDNLTQSVIDNSHTHTNKSVLDGINSTKVSNWDNAATNSHTHSNKAVLDNLTQSVIDNSHTHSNKSVLDGISSTKVSHWDTAYSQSHTHANKSILDGISQTDINKWNSGYTYGVSAYTQLNDLFYTDASGNTHSRYNFIGDNAVSCYGTSTSESGGGGSITGDGRTINKITASGGTILGGTGSTLNISSHTHSNIAALNNISNTNITNWNNAATSAHSHSNISVLDLITNTKITNWDNAATNNHTHSNKSVLDGINSTKVSHWDEAYTYEHEHDNKAVLDDIDQSIITNSHTHSNKSVLDGITSTKVSHWDTAYTNNHTHSNKSVLDGITSAKVSSWNNITNKYDKTGGTISGDAIVTGKVVTDTIMPYDEDSNIIKIGQNDNEGYVILKTDTLIPYEIKGTNGNTTGSWSSTPWKITSGGAATFSGITSTSTLKVSGATTLGNASGNTTTIKGSTTIGTNKHYSSGNTTTINGRLIISGTTTASTSNDSRIYLGKTTSYIRGTGDTISVNCNNNFAVNASNLINLNAETHVTDGSLYVDDGNLEVNGDITAQGNILAMGEVSCYSDRRLKSDIKPLEDRGELNPVTFVKDGKQCIGFIAQDIEENYPELVSDDSKGYKTLNYQAITAILAVQINDLRKEINELKKQMNYGK